MAGPGYPVRFLNEIGHLRNPFSRDRRTQANLAGLARVFSYEKGFRFEGRDLAGKPWRVFAAGEGGVGWTGVWTADLDRNGRPDLLIGSYFPGNGRCVDGGDVLVLLFDAAGRPVPWRSGTMIPDGALPGAPAVLLDADRDGRAEIVTTSCERTDGQRRFGEDRRITGVYEARDARWVPLRDRPLEPYRRAARAGHRQGGPGFAEWRPTQPREWPDQMSGIDAPATIRLDRLITAEAGCGGIRVIVEGNRVKAPDDDPCEVLGRDRAVHSDGSTRLNWPPAVIDGPEGRDIYVIDTGEALRRILRGNYAVRMLGGEAEPDWLWARADEAAAPSRVVSEVVTARVTKQPVLVVEEDAGQPAGPFDLIVSRGDDCFLFDPSNASLVRRSKGCPHLAALRRAGIAGPLRVKESMAWQTMASERRLRTFRSDDGGALAEYAFTPPRAGAELVNAVEFGPGFLVHWRIGRARGLALHNGSGRPLTDMMPAGVEGNLLAGSASEGMLFVRWKDGRPAELTRCGMAVSWTRR